MLIIKTDDAPLGTAMYWIILDKEAVFIDTTQKEVKQERPHKRVMDVREMAEYLGLCKNTAYWLLHTEGFPAVKFGRRYLVTEDALVAWLNSKQGETVDIWQRR